MTVLEASLRNLVREEATAAAVKAIDAIPANPHTLEGSRDDIVRAIGEAARIEFARIRGASKHIGAEEERCGNSLELPARLDPQQIAHYRKRSIELAIAAGASPDNLMAIAEQCARFIVDGALDGKKWAPPA